MNAVGRRLSESRVRENLMHGLRWQAMETETTAPSLDPTRTRLGNEEVYSRTARVSTATSLIESGCNCLMRIKKSITSLTNSDEEYTVYFLYFRRSRLNVNRKTELLARVTDPLAGIGVSKFYSKIVNDLLE